MTQRIVMRFNHDYETLFGALCFLVDQGRELGVGTRSKVQYAVDAEGVPCLYVELPERAAEALERAAAGPRATKAQQAVRGQLQARAEAVRSGEPVPGHVPPVAKRGRVLKTTKTTRKKKQ